jgi:hypothetical protein
MKISNAGPLIVLYKSSLLDILKELYGNIIVPNAVYDEIKRKEEGRQLFQENNWINVQKVKNKQTIAVLKSFVDIGETEAIALSLELKKPLLIDDKKGREIAKSMNVSVQGSLGILAKAKKEGVIKSVKDAIAKILAAGYYLDRQLKNEVLRYVEETSK